MEGTSNPILPGNQGLEPLRSVHTTNLPGLLNELGISVLVTTYQANRLVLIRAIDGALNTHFRVFLKPMGLAFRGNRLAIGAAFEVHDFRNVPDSGRRLDPNLDACFLPRSTHQTGEILIHEVAWGKDELWLVNTRFSCLCTLHRDYSFVPRWRPPFVTAYTPDDRCHLNGLAMAAGAPKYVTALGQTNSAESWRKHKAFGGVLMDVATSEVLVDGLSMPHSPRFYDGKVWLLNSGEGSIGTVDVEAASYRPLTKLPGFTRGLDFFGRYAFIGLSQIRESAEFSGIEITQRLPPHERWCGVCVVDIHKGQTVAFVRFEDALQEIFAVQVLPGIRRPELILDDKEMIGTSYVLPDGALADVPESISGSRPKR